MGVPKARDRSYKITRCCRCRKHFGTWADTVAKCTECGHSNKLKPRSIMPVARVDEALRTIERLNAAYERSIQPSKYGEMKHE